MTLLEIEIQRHESMIRVLRNTILSERKFERKERLYVNYEKVLISYFKLLIDEESSETNRAQPTKQLREVV